MGLPGRVEMKEMFQSMYSGLEKLGESPATAREEAERGKKSGVDDESNSDEESLLKRIGKDKHEDPITEDELKRLSEKFAEELPEDKLSLAAVQGYLLRYKHDPRAAVTHAKAWSEETLANMKELET